MWYDLKGIEHGCFDCEFAHRCEDREIKDLGIGTFKCYDWIPTMPLKESLQIDKIKDDTK